MDAPSFIKTTADFFEKWLTQVNQFISSGQLNINGRYFYPTMLRVGESPDHYIAELIGAKTRNHFDVYRIDRPKLTEKVRNTSLFFNSGFDVNDKQKATFQIRSHHNSISSICLCTKYDKKRFNEKINFPVSKVKIITKDADVPLIIKTSSDYLSFYRVDLIRTDSFRVLFRTVSTAIVVKKTTSKQDLIKWFTDEAKRFISLPISKTVFGLNLFSSSSEIFAKELSSLTSQQVNEATIDKFIRKNKSYFSNALGYKKAISKPRLQIIDKKGWDKDYLEPDYLMQNENGNYDILDLKKALLKCKSVTIGGKSRCRFNAYANELIAQLKGYDRYFKNDKNKKWALKNKGIRINNPRLIGIVGDHNNFDKYSVKMALEQYKKNIVIVSYEELINLLKKLG